MGSTFTTTRRVAFAETDMAGIVHFANFYRYMEEAEHAFFRSRGLRIIQQQPDGSTLSWPRVFTSCSYDGPARYEDVLEIAVSVEQIGTKSLTLGYDFRNGGTSIATGRMKTVCCLFRPDQAMEPIEIPPEVRRRLESAGNEQNP